MEQFFDILLELIKNVGFPIVVALICFWYINKKDIEHKEEVNKLAEAIQNNTRVMEKFLAKLGDER